MLDNFLIAGALVLACDQASKNVVLRQDERRRSASPPRFLFRLRLVRSTPFGLELVADQRMLLWSWAAAVAGTILVAAFVPAFGDLLRQASLGAAVGGATGNLLDLIRHGAVIDFIDLRVWPVFNLADVAIVIGVAVALWPVI